MIGRFRIERPAIPFLSLTTDSSVLTSIANDVSVETLFSRQVEALGHPGDGIVCISTSGSSPNILAAAAAARRRAMQVAALTGRTPNPLAHMADIVVDVPSSVTPRIQEIHALVIHTICGLVEAAIAGLED